MILKIDENPLITRLNLATIKRDDINILWKEKTLEIDFMDFRVPSKDQKTQLKLTTYRCNPSNPPKAIIIYLHGYGADSEHTDYQGKFFAELDLVYVSFDFRGHGNSEGSRTEFDSVDQLMEDTKLFNEKIKEIYPDLPIFISGISMGGLIAYKLSLEKPEDYIGVILFAPALQTKAGWCFEKFILCLTTLCCCCKCSFSKDLSNVVRNEDVKIKINEEMKKRENYSYFHFGTFNSLMKKMASATPTFKDYKASFIIFMGGNDKSINPNSAFKLINESPSLDKHLYFYEEMFHFVVADDEVFDVLDKSKSFILRKLKEIEN